MAFRPGTTTAEDKQRALDLLANGFTTKSGQKSAMEAVGNAFEKTNSKLADFILTKEDRKGSVYDDAYWNKPSYIHQFKDAKHGAWYDWIDQREFVNELLVLRNEIKSAPIVKQASKAELKQQSIKATSGREHIEGAVAHLKDDAVARAEQEAVKVIKIVAKDLEAHGMDMNKAAPYPRQVRTGDDERAVSKHQLYSHLVKSVGYSYGGGPRIVEMSDTMSARFIERAKEDAAAQYDAFVNKLIEKIGAVASAKLEGDHVWGFSYLTVTLPDGSKEVWKTQMIVNVSKLGKLFNQFPTRRMK